MRGTSTLIRLAIAVSALVLPLVAAGCGGADVSTGSGSGGGGGSAGGSLTIYGSVVDTRGIPVEGVTVTLDGKVVSTTAKGGGFGFTQVTVGTHTLQAAGFSLQTTTKSVAVTKDDNDKNVAVLSLKDAGPIPETVTSTWYWQGSDGIAYEDYVNSIGTHAGHQAAEHIGASGSAYWEYADAGAIYDDSDTFFGDTRCSPAYVPAIPATLTAGSTSVISAQCDGGTKSASVQIIGQEAVKVPAGTYDAAWHIHYVFNSGASQDQWLVPGTGLVKLQNASNTLQLSSTWLK